MRALRAASEQQLFDESAPRLAAFLAEGVTTIEIKSGYGLTLNDEAKMLRVARELGRAFPVTVRTTLLAAHTVPPEYQGRADDYIDAVGREWLPALTREGLVDAVDVFCEGIAFSVAQAERLFAAARALGVPVKMHAEQLSNLGGSLAAARLGALSCDHLEYAGEAEAAALAAAGTAAVLLPVAFYCLRRYARAAGRGTAGRRRCDRGRQRLQSGLGARHLAPDRHEHGDPPVRAHRRGGAAGRDAPRRPGAGPCRTARRARTGRGGRLRGVERRRRRGARLLDWFQPPPDRGPRGGGTAMAESEVLKLGARPLRLADLRRVYAAPVSVAIDAQSLGAVREAHAATLRLAAADAPAYGINTGFGLLAQTRIAPAQRTLLQRNIILSHSAGRRSAAR